MKLKLTALSAAILLTSSVLTSSALAAAATGVAPTTNIHPNTSHSTIGTGIQEHGPKKIDPKLQAKLDTKVDSVSEEEYQKIVSEYKKYLAGVPSAVRQEIRGYRKEMVQLNKAKSALYKKLSQEAQNFLSKERDMKKKLPIRNKADFAKEIRNSDAE